MVSSDELGSAADFTVLRKFEVEPGTGHSSNWSHILYVQFRQPDLAPQRKSGVSLGYFFRFDLTALYLSVFVGAESLSSTESTARHEVLKLREIIAVPPRFRLDRVELGHKSGLAFEKGHIWGIRYDADALPDEATLRSDLEELSAAYGAADRAAVEAAIEPGRTTAVPRPAPLPSTTTPYSMEELIADTLWPRGALEEVLAALDPEGQVSRQVILAGPPGTGKTWIARKLVRFVTQGDRSRSRFVQFHPSYSYEQFIEGLKPVAEGGAVRFKQEPGVVLRLVEAMAGRLERHYLIIDELNRANLPRVFGELMFCSSTGMKRSILHSARTSSCRRLWHLSER